MPNRDVVTQARGVLFFRPSPGYGVGDLDANCFRWRVALPEIHTLLKPVRSIIAKAEHDPGTQP